MAFFEWEKVVIDVGGGPIETANIMAFDTIGRIASILVVGLGGGVKIIEVAIDTFIAQPVEPEGCFGSMALITTNDSVCA